MVNRKKAMSCSNFGIRLTRLFRIQGLAQIQEKSNRPSAGYEIKYFAVTKQNLKWHFVDRKGGHFLFEDME